MSGQRGPPTFTSRARDEYEITPKTPCCICKKSVWEDADLVLVIPPCFHVQCEKCTYKHHSGDRCADCMTVYRYPGTPRRRRSSGPKDTTAGPSQEAQGIVHASVGRAKETARREDDEVSSAHSTPAANKKELASASTAPATTTPATTTPATTTPSTAPWSAPSAANSSIDSDDLPDIITTSSDHYGDHYYSGHYGATPPARVGDGSSGSGGGGGGAFGESRVSYHQAKRKMEESVPPPPPSGAHADSQTHYRLSRYKRRRK